MTDKEKLALIADRANRYNLKALLEQLCYYSNPEENRRNLMQCYFFISRQISRTGEGAGENMGNALSFLSLLIEAIDLMTEEPAGLSVIVKHE